jgi:hypothetical protein
MSNNPYDDLLRNLARLIEQVAGLEQNMRSPQERQSDNTHIFGCAIITGGVPQDQEIPIRRPFEVGYEIIDAGDIAYLTVALPSSLSTSPELEFTRETVYISAGSSRAPISLTFPIKTDSCSYQLINGLMDITLVKDCSPVEGE